MNRKLLSLLTALMLCAAPAADVHFLSGGTQANKTVIGAFLRPYEAVIAAVSGHITAHETAAIENNGHKILTVAGVDGKVTPAEIESVVAANSAEYTPAPRLVYISNTTEIGTVYSKDELEALHELSFAAQV